MSAAVNKEQALREEICDVGRSLYQRGYTVGSAGNISARLDDGWLITPTDVCLGRLDPAAIAKVNLAGSGCPATSHPRPWPCIARSMTATRASVAWCTPIPPTWWR